MISVLVTGKDSQLAQCLKDVEVKYPDIKCTYFNSTDLDITCVETITNKFIGNDYDFCINCAAYTAVDNAESEPERARITNTQGTYNLAKACHKFNTTLIHISTDFVFDGKKRTPYTENDATNPLNIYGQSKRNGELKIMDVLEKYFIIRTSWLYSEHGNNFVKTILRLAKEKSEISVVDDQIGSPTYAGDLAEVLFKIISSNSTEYGVYHYSNSGETSWYGFAKAVLSNSALCVRLNNVSSAAYNSVASRPKYTVLSSSKIAKTFKIPIKQWEVSLKSY